MFEKSDRRVAGRFGIHTDKTLKRNQNITDQGILFESTKRSKFISHAIEDLQNRIEDINLKAKALEDVKLT